MSINLLKKYSDLLELTHFNEQQRTESLLRIFNRDIAENVDFKFLTKQIRPIKNEDGKSSMDTLFYHLTTREPKDAVNKHRDFDMLRSLRLHWIKHNISRSPVTNIDIFSCEERTNGKDRIRTYILDTQQNYVIILEPQDSKLDYYLLTAYPITENWGMKQILKKKKNQLTEIY